MNGKVIGGAVIGYGGMGGFHSEKMQSVDGVELLGVYDIDPERNELAESRASMHIRRARRCWPIRRSSS